MIEHTVLDKKLQALSGFPGLQPQAVTRFGEILAGLDAWDLRRINPFRFAEQHDLDPRESVGLFLHATKVGLFDFAWNLICPVCGLVEYSYESINSVDEHEFWCSVCQMDVSSELDDHVEVSFTINPSVSKLKFDPYTSPAHFHRYFFTENLGYTPQQTAQLLSCMVGIQPILPDRTGVFRFDATPDRAHQITNITLHKALNIALDPAKPAGRPHIEEVAVVPGGFAPEAVTVPPGPVEIHLRNLTRQSMDFLHMGKDPVKMGALMNNLPPFLPMLSGKKLLNNQDFRNLYRIQELRSDLKLNIRSLTVLFTDLKGSTELYDRLGDANAYNLIQTHFRVLSQAVWNHAGAIVKTMGDAIMATFSSPHEGIRASLEMAEKLRELNASRQIAPHELGLKVGLHEGTVLAVNADERLDYFGQTVNIAARVQGLASAGEIWLTRPVFEANRVAPLLAEQGYRHEQRSVRLKGVSDATTVFRMYDEKPYNLR